MSGCGASLPPKRVAFPANAVIVSPVNVASGSLWDEAGDHELPVKVYAPEVSDAKLPIVLLVQRDPSESLGRALASRGFYTLQIASDRDVAFALDVLASAQDSNIDTERIAIVGARALPRDRRMKAIIAISMPRIESEHHRVTFEDHDPHPIAVEEATIALLRALLLDDREMRAWLDDAGTGELMGMKVAVTQR